MFQDLKIVKHLGMFVDLELVQDLEMFSDLGIVQKSSEFSIQIEQEKVVLCEEPKQILDVGRQESVSSKIISNQILKSAHKSFRTFVINIQRRI